MRLIDEYLLPITYILQRLFPKIFHPSYNLDEKILSRFALMQSNESVHRHAVTVVFKNEFLTV